MGIAIVAVVVLAIAFFIIGMYNSLVSLRQRQKNAFSQIDVQLKRRWDLVPALVATVQGYAHHEAQTLENVVAARNQAARAGTARPQRRSASENHLGGDHYLLSLCQRRCQSQQ